MTKLIQKTTRFILSRDGFYTLLVIAIAVIPHTINMFHYPYYENDEGTYISQAWSILTQAKLAPYTYWYDHAPAGWIFLAIWIKLTGGIFRFGTAINTGRVFMTVIQSASALLLFYIARKLSSSVFAAFLAIVLFSIAPLAIYFHRRVLLDNIMIFWMLASLAILYTKHINLKKITLSGLLFGISVLTKESAIFFIPGVIYVLYTLSHRSHRRFAIATWLAITTFVISLYFLYALIKFELFPEGIFVQYHHVSLITTLLEQMQRGSNLPFWDKKSEFYINLLEWLNKDSIIMIVGFVSSILCCVLAIWKKNIRVAVLLTIFYSLFLIRGKIVIDFYIVPLLLLFSLNTALVINILPLRKILTVLAILIFVFLYVRQPIYKYQFIQDETTPQLNAISWIKSHLNSNDFIAIDNYAYVDLHDSKKPSEKIFPNAEWVWKIERDDEIKKQKLQNDWRNIQYILLSHEIVKQIKNHEFPFTKSALVYSSMIADWSQNTTSYIDLQKYISTNGDWAKIYKVKDEKTIEAENSWSYVKSHFISSYGQVVDRNHNERTTSEDQSMVMLRALVENDPKTFDGVWKWTKDHLQFRETDTLFSSLWQKNEDDIYRVTDYHSTSSADIGIAEALALGYVQYGNNDYIDQSKAIISDIWKQEVVRVQNRYYIRSSAAEEYNGKYLINVADISPAAFRIFALVDKDHPWDEIASDSYIFLNEIADSRNKNLKSPLPANYYLVDKNTGKVSSAKDVLGINADFSGDQTARLIWNIKLDSIWFYSKESEDYQNKIRPFFRNKWIINQGFSAVYDEDGNEVVPFGSKHMDTAIIGIFSESDPEISQSLYNSSIKAHFYQAGYWPNNMDLDDQNTNWAATSLYYNRLDLLGNLEKI